jgi:hypothetical protein
MPTLSFTVTYDGSDPEILHALSRFASALSTNNEQNGQVSALPSSDSIERIAGKFAGYISRTNRLKNVMIAWLRRDGKIPLVELVKVSGVKKQHDYAGIGSALTRNMKKAGGPKDWYDGNQDVHGDWNYEIAGELVQPLKRAFKL